MGEPSVDRTRSGRILSFGGYELDTGSLELVTEGKVVPLAPLPARLLAVLATRPGELLSRSELRELLWGESTFVEYEGSLNFCVNQARSALGDRADAPRFIETLRGRGYRFIATVSETAPALPPPPAPPAPAPRTSPARDSSRWAAPFELLATALGLLILLGARGDTHAYDPLSGDAVQASIAVLPFTTPPNDPMQRHLREAVSVELTGALHRSGVLRVASAASVTARTRKDMEASSVARELGVHAVLMGTVTRNEERISMTARLLKAPLWEVLWEERYDRPFNELFAIRDAVAAQTVESFGVELSPEARRLMERGATESPEAFDLLWRAAEYYRQYRAHDFDNAIALYRQAIAADPNYATAHATLANGLMQRYLHRGFPPQARDEALRSAERALAIDPNVPQAYKAIGMAHHSYGRFEASVAAYERALELWPEFAAVIHNLGRVEYLRGRWISALHWQREQMRFNPRHHLAAAVMAETLLGLGQRSEAEELLARVAEKEPRYVVMHLVIANDELREGKLESARERVSSLLETDPGNVAVQTLAGHVELAAGRDERAASHFGRALELPHGNDAYAAFRVASIRWRSGERSVELREALEAFADGCRLAVEEGFEGPSRPLGVALVDALLGNRDGATAWLERAFEAGRLDYRWDRLDPAFESLRSHPRFVALMERMVRHIESMRAEVTVD